MPRVRLLARMNVADGYYERGEVVDVSGEVASSLSRLGRVEIMRGERPETPERNTAEKAKARSKRPEVR